MDSIRIRDATERDIPALAELHVRTWNATYPHVSAPPSVALRERQWRDAFARQDGSWFCLLVEKDERELIGFAKGNRYDEHEPAGFDGQLNKIYLLREYQGRGLGRELLGHVADRFLSQGIRSMVLFAEPDNPTCGFYERMGAERLFAASGEFHGGYGWRDLKPLLVEKAGNRDAH